MRYLSVCSGIEAASVAWHPLGWVPVAFSEIEAFPSAVLKHHYPDVPNFGDMTKFKEWPDATVDVLVGGTPCQSFSVAGLRKGLADPRGNLALTYLAIADRYRPRWVVWENVPGVLSSDSHVAPDSCPPDIDLDASNGPVDGQEIVVEDRYDADEDHAFACFLAGLSDLGYGLAYRTLDAQYFGLAQRRQRVFVVGYLGDWRRAAAVLFERESLQGHPPPRREAGQKATGTIGARTTAGGGLGTDFECDGGLVPDVVGTLTGGSATDRNHGKRSGSDRDPLIPEVSPADGTGDGMPLLPMVGALSAKDGEQGFTTVQAAMSGMLQPIAFGSRDHGGDAMEDCSPTLRAGGHHHSHAGGGVGPAVAIRTNQTGANGHGFNDEIAHTLDSTTGQAVAFKPSHYTRAKDGVPSAVYPPLSADADKGDQEAVVLSFQPGNLTRGFGPEPNSEMFPTLRSHSTRSDQDPHVMASMQVRRLTPRECERLQGFPDDYTLVPYNRKPAADGPRYKALGNSMATNVMAWIGKRIQMVDDIS